VEPVSSLQCRYRAILSVNLQEDVTSTSGHGLETGSSFYISYKQCLKTAVLSRLLVVLMSSTSPLVVLALSNNETDLRAIGWDGMDWIDLAQGKDQWRALVNTVMNLRVT
jgi:hypothetical protein